LSGSGFHVVFLGLVLLLGVVPALISAKTRNTTLRLGAVFILLVFVGIPLAGGLLLLARFSIILAVVGALVAVYGMLVLIRKAAGKEGVKSFEAYDQAYYAKNNISPTRNLVVFILGVIFVLSLGVMHVMGIHCPWC
jgi:hypothetical protein